MKIFRVLLLSVLMAAVSCTNLDEGIYDRQVADDFYSTEEGIRAALANVYNEVRGDWGGKGIAGADRGWYDLNEVSTDEMMIPTRADGAWSDNGIWRAMYEHQWTPAHEFMNNTWNWLYRAVFKSNLAVDLLTTANADPEAIAEARVLRAYFYYMLLDGWGNVPFYTDNSVTVENIPQSDRAEVYDFVIGELTTYVPQLSETIDGEFYGRFNKWAGYALMAKVYLNAEVYTGTEKWSECIEACNQITGNASFSLVSAGEYFSELFGAHCDAREVLLAVYVNANSAPRNIIGIRSLAGPQGQALFGFSTWNGATAHKNFVNKFANEDIRKEQWITGPQAGGVNYNLEIASLTAAGGEDGARNTKFLPVAPYNGGSSSNHFPVFRLADVLLTKAEALVRDGQAGSAKSLVDAVRTRAGLTALAGNPTLDDIYDERGRELCWEGHRRQDMIRFGTFTQAHDFKATSDDHYELFPIPTPAIAANPSLDQNDEY